MPTVHSRSAFDSTTMPTTARISEPEARQHLGGLAGGFSRKRGRGLRVTAQEDGGGSHF